MQKVYKFLCSILGQVIFDFDAFSKEVCLALRPSGTNAVTDLLSRNCWCFELKNNTRTYSSGKFILHDANKSN